MKRNIFVAIHYLEIGGAEISLIGLLNAIDYTQYYVDLFVYSHRGELMKLIPPQVNLLPEIDKYSFIEKPLKETIKRGYLDIAYARIMAKLEFENYRKKKKPKDISSYFQYIANRVTPCLPKINSKEYDFAISFLTPHNIVLEKIKAKRKIAWIHTDYSYIDVDVKKELPIWEEYDYIASISDAVTCSFLNTFPTLKAKIALIENILSPNFVRRRAEETSIILSSEKDRINLLSIGRFTEAKNFDNVPDILRRVRENGINTYWYIIGFGAQEELIKSKIAEANMQDYVILLGKKENPYPFIKACDIYVQPSRYEGKSVTVREAQMLYKPIVVTNYTTASSQIKNGKDGIIVPLDNKACADGIVTFIRNDKQRKEIIEFLKSHDYGNEKEVEKLYQIIN